MTIDLTPEEQGIESAKQLMPYQPSNDLDLFDPGKAPAVVSSFAEPAESAAALMDSAPLIEHLGVTIKLKNIVAHKVTLNTESGQILARRIVIVDDEGNAYHCVSIGVYGALQIIFGLFGMPPKGGYNPPIPVVAKTEKAKVGKTLTLVVMADKKAKKGK